MQRQFGSWTTLGRDIQALSIHCEDVDEKTIKSIVDTILEENDGHCLDLPGERDKVSDALVKALTK